MIYKDNLNFFRVNINKKNATGTFSEPPAYRYQVCDKISVEDAKLLVTDPDPTFFLQNCDFKGLLMAFKSYFLKNT
jgi:hypothetical protein